MSKTQRRADQAIDGSVARVMASRREPLFFDQVPESLRLGPALDSAGHLFDRIATCTAGVIAYAIRRDQATVATELIKTIASLGAVAFGGYGLAKSRKE